MLLLYDYIIKYKSTCDCGHADALSRLMSNHELENGDTVIASLLVEKDVNRILVNATQILPLVVIRVVYHTRSDSILE